MNQIPAEIWVQLDKARPVGDNLTARSAILDKNNRLQCAIDSDGRRHLIIKLLPSEKDLCDKQSRGISVESRDMIIHDDPGAHYMDIQCLDAGGNDAFNQIGTEIAAELVKPSNTPEETVKHVLAKWRRFWGQLPRTILSREEILGLFGELWFLAVWLIPSVGATEAVQRWRGPFGSRHDYESTGKSVEIKTTASVRGCIYHINGLDQLNPPESGVLFLFSLHVREEAGATNSLPVIVESIYEKIGTDDETLNRFDAALAQAGYSILHKEEYSKLRFRIIDEGLYAVKGDFPRLLKECFPDNTLKGIERVEYEININGYNHLRIATSPDKAGKHLK